MSEKLGGSNPEIGDFEKKPELDTALPPASEAPESDQPTVNAYGLKPEDVQQLQRFFAALAKDDLLIPAYRAGVKNMGQRVQLLQYPDIFNEMPLDRPKLPFFPNLLRGIGERFRVWLVVAQISTEILGERSKTKPRYTFDLRHMVENGIQVHILATVLRCSKKQKVLNVLPDESVTSYLYGNAGRRLMWGISFDERAPQAFPGRDAYDNTEEL